jgi:hypothetical protein
MTIGQAILKKVPVVPKMIRFANKGCGGARAFMAELI